MSQNEEISRETTRQVAALFQITAAIEHFQKHEVECAITLQSAVEGVVVPLVGRLALRLRQRLLGFQRIVDDDDIGTPARSAPRRPRRRAGSLVSSSRIRWRARPMLPAGVGSALLLVVAISREHCTKRRGWRVMRLIAQARVQTLRSVQPRLC